MDQELDFIAWYMSVQRIRPGPRNIILVEDKETKTDKQKMAELNHDYRTHSL